MKTEQDKCRQRYTTRAAALRKKAAAHLKVAAKHKAGTAYHTRSTRLAAILERQAKDYDEKARKCT